MAALRPLVASLIVAALAACQPLGCGMSTVGDTDSAAEAATSHLQAILARGNLRVGMSGDQPPLNMTTKSGGLMGLDVDVVHSLAESMGLDLKVVKRPFAELLPALERGEVDLVISGMTITPERNARVAFVGPYLVSGKSVLTKSDAIAAVESSDALNVAENSYAALAGSTSEDFVRRVLPKAKLVSVPDYDAAIQMVLKDEVDAMVGDFPVVNLTVMRYPDAGLEMLSTPFTIEPLGIALPPDDPLFVNLVENYMKTLEQTGLLTQFKAKWFNEGPWLDELP